jgi:DNA-binding transcriptional LysR family regulator
VNDALTHLEACMAGQGVAQVMDLGIESLLQTGKVANLFPDWSDELFPLYIYHPSRRFVPAKLRVFIDFLASALPTQESSERSLQEIARAGRLS